MATKEKKQGKKREVQAQVQAEHAGKDLPVPPARLRVYYENTVRDRLKSQFVGLQVTPHSGSSRNPADRRD